LSIHHGNPGARIVHEQCIIACLLAQHIQGSWDHAMRLDVYCLDPCTVDDYLATLSFVPPLTLSSLIGLRNVQSTNPIVLFIPNSPLSEFVHNAA
jgi:hypothetical protein